MLRLALRAAFFAVFWSGTLQGSPIQETHIEHESREGLTNVFTKRSEALGYTIVPVKITLVQSNLDAAHDELMDISDPNSPRFGKHWSPEQVVNFFQPSRASIDSVRAWIEQTIQPHWIELSLNKQWLGFNTSISKLEQMLLTKYYHYQIPGKPHLRIGCDQYSVPITIKNHIDFITPGVTPLEMRPREIVKRSASQAPTKRSASPVYGNQELASRQANPCAGAMQSSQTITPACVKQVYSVNDTPPANTTASVGIFNHAQEIYGPSDLTTFFSSYASYIPSSTQPNFNSIDGAPPPGTYGSSGGYEANLDVQMVYPYAYPAKVVEYQVDDEYYEFQLRNRTLRGLFNTFLDAIDGSYCNYTAFGITGNSAGIDPTYPDTNGGSMGHYNGTLQCGVYQPTDVITFSYIIAEEATPVNYQRRQCNEWMKLGLQGVSLIFASGDSGVGTQYDPTAPGSTTDCIGPNHNVFGPNAPSNCPYVTSVGATYLQQDGKTEQGDSISSGGFSNIFPTPSYQSSAVNNYLTNHPPPYASYNTSYALGPPAGTNGRYNRAGRGYPDVSALGEGLVTVVRGSPVTQSGTSASAPIFAGIIARINEARIAAGKSRLGFLNQILYNNPQMFNDITTGNNPARACANQTGFSAAAGWDPVTGLGTPNYTKMKAVMLALS